MDFIKKNIVGLVAIIIAIAACFLPVLPKGESIVGRVGTQFDHGITVGLNSVSPTNLSKVLVGTCSLTAGQGNSGGFTVAATSSAAFDCPVAGVVAGDRVFVQFATSTLSAGVNGGWTVEAASASTTSGSVRVVARNNTGTSNIMPASIGSTTQYLVIGTQ